jgi:transcriptional/translational regulatory protein YebC/TACO1
VALENARKQSVTRDTIERAIAKGSGTGADAIQYDTVVFEGFGPHRVPVIVEALTDNNNRTSSDVRVIFRAGSLGQRGSVAWMFEHCGLIEAHHPDAAADIEVAALEAEADEVEPLELDEDDAELKGHVGARFSVRAINWTW